MSDKLCIAYFAHSLRSDWNNGNVHFLRGLMRALAALGHQVKVLELEAGWSIENLRKEPCGVRSLADFGQLYPDIPIHKYSPEADLIKQLSDMDIVILHEWHPTSFAQQLLSLRDKLGYKLLFHDTHHRASSTPKQLEAFGLRDFDGVLA